MHTYVDASGAVRWWYKVESHIKGIGKTQIIVPGYTCKDQTA